MRASRSATIRDRLILPGFIDGHIHFPQTRVIGAFGEQLLPWLQKWVFPEELKYKDRDYAREGARRFFDNLLASGTTTCQAFTTTFAVSTEELFDEAARRNVRLIAGLTGIDRMAPADYADSADDFYRDSKRLIERYHRQGRNLYAITPRFALGASPELMAACQRLKREHPDCWVNTHISETVDECEAMRRAYPDCADYLAVYEKYGLVGPKFSGGHGVWLSDGEFRRISRKRRGDRVLPVLQPVPRQRPVPHRPRHRSRHGASGCRSAATSAPAIASRCSTCSTRPTRSACATTRTRRGCEPRPSATRSRPIAASGRSRWAAPRAFISTTWSATSSPARRPTSSSSTGMAGPPAQAWRQSLWSARAGPQTIEQAADLLFGLMMVGDDRAVDETWVDGAEAIQENVNSWRYFTQRRDILAIPFGLLCMLSHERPSESSGRFARCSSV